MDDVDIAAMLKESVQARSRERSLSDKATAILVWIAEEALVQSPRIEETELHRQLIRLGKELNGG